MKYTNSVEILSPPTHNLIVLSTNTVKIHKITSFEAFMKLKPDFGKLRKAVMIDGKIITNNLPLHQ